MSIAQIRLLCADRGILTTRKNIKECILATAQKYETTTEEIEDHIIAHLTDEIRTNSVPKIKVTPPQGEALHKKPVSKNFIDEIYDITIDDQAVHRVAFSEQEYLSRDFKKFAVIKYPIFDQFSHKPNVPQFRNSQYWHIQKSIRELIPKLENTHWTNQTLSYARNNIIGKHIVGCVIFPLVKKGLFSSLPLVKPSLGSSLAKNHDLSVSPHVNVVDATGNIGMDSITLALEKFVNHVTTYEILPEVYEMLVNNIDLYGMKKKITPLNKRFDYQSSALKNALVIIDPPYEADNNGSNFNLSIDSFPIYEVVRKILDAGSKCVILTMPKTYKYNIRFAKDNDQHVTVYQMGNKNNKLFVIVSAKDATRINLQPSGTFYFITTDETKKDWHSKVDAYQCKTNKMDDMENFSLVENTKQNRLIAGKVDIKIDPATKRNILTKVFGKNVELGKNGQIDILRTLARHLGKDEFDDKWGFNKSADSFTRKNAQLLKYMPKNIGVYVDIGCGSGTDMLAMNRTYNIKKGICVDIKDLRAKENILDDDVFIEAKPRKILDIPSNTVDVITMFHTIHHVQGDFMVSGMLSYLKDIHRIVKKGGLVFIKDHNVSTSLEASNVDFEHLSYTVSSWKKGLNNLLDNYGTIEPMIYYTSAEITNLMKSWGFELLWTNIMSKLTYIYGSVFRKI